MKKTFYTSQGLTIVRDCMVDLDGKNLEPGVSIAIVHKCVAEVNGITAHDITEHNIEEIISNLINS
jgi:hypothetical protein